MLSNFFKLWFLNKKNLKIQEKTEMSDQILLPLFSALLSIFYHLFAIKKWQSSSIFFGYDVETKEEIRLSMAQSNLIMILWWKNRSKKKNSQMNKWMIGKKGIWKLYYSRQKQKTKISFFSRTIIIIFIVDNDDDDKCQIISNPKNK